MVTTSESAWLALRCEPAQRLQSWQEEVCSAAHGRKGRKARDLAANRPLWNLEFECPVLSADDRIPLIPELMEVPVVDPNVLRELKLPNETRADYECRDSALLAVVGGALRKIRTIGRSTA